MDHEKHLSRLADMAESLDFTSLGGRTDEEKKKNPLPRLTLPKEIFPKTVVSGEEFMLVSFVKVSGIAENDDVSIDLSEAASVEVPQEKQKPQKEPEGESADENADESTPTRGKFSKAMMGQG